MYTTRLLSMCRKDPNVLLQPPHETPNSGYIVITDEETEGQDTCCWGSCTDHRVKHLPFPQNKILNVTYTSVGQDNQVGVEEDRVWFLPVLDQPLSSNRYYVIRAKGRHTGEACTCSKEEDKGSCCCFKYVKDVKHTVLDPRDIYQQVEIVKGRFGFKAKSVAPNGYPPWFLRRKDWTLRASSSFKCELTQAHGLNHTLRTKLPEFKFSASADKRSNVVVVGKWYCPFGFVKEDGRLKNQMKRSLFYEMTLEQSWEEIYTCENANPKNKTVVVNVEVQKEVNRLLGLEALKDDTHGRDGTVWYKQLEPKGKITSLGLSIAIVEKMIAVQKMGGWDGKGGKSVRVERTESSKGKKGWKIFSCFALVETFALRRLDRTLLLTCDFRHIHKIRSKWE